MLKLFKSFFLAGFFVLSVIMASGCGSSSGSVECKFPSPTAATFDLNGSWTFAITNRTSSDPDCDSSETDSETVTVTVTGNTIVVTSPGDPDFRLEGQVSGSQVILGGSNIVDGDTTIFDCTIMPVTDGGDTITFSTEFSFTSGILSCDGTATGTFTRI